MAWPQQFALFLAPVSATTASAAKNRRVGAWTSAGARIKTLESDCKSSGGVSFKILSEGAAAKRMGTGRTMTMSFFAT